jgi:hypothetical protein
LLSVSIAADASASAASASALRLPVDGGPEAKKGCLLEVLLCWL